MLNKWDECQASQSQEHLGVSLKPWALRLAQFAEIFMADTVTDTC